MTKTYPFSRLSKAIILLCLCSGASVVYAQDEYLPFKASEGLQHTLRQAQVEGMVKPKPTFISAIGDTTGIAALIPEYVLPLIQYNPVQGTSPFWTYRLWNDDGSDTSRNYGTISIKSFGYRTFAYTFPKPDIPAVEIYFALPPLFMDSDTMTARIIATNAYQRFISQQPEAKFQYIGLGMSRGGSFPTGPLWTVLIRSSSGARLSCYVQAENNSTAPAICTELPPTDVEEENRRQQTLQLSPHPVSTTAILHIPLNLYAAEIELEIYSLLGLPLQSYQLRVGGEEKIIFPTDELPNGTYLLRYKGGKHTQSLFFTVEH